MKNMITPTLLFAALLFAAVELPVQAQTKAPVPPRYKDVVGENPTADADIQVGRASLMRERRATEHAAQPVNKCPSSLGGTARKKNRGGATVELKLVVLGALHLFGANALPALMAQRGYRVLQIEFKP